MWRSVRTRRLRQTYLLVVYPLLLPTADDGHHSPIEGSSLFAGLGDDEEDLFGSSPKRATIYEKKKKKKSAKLFSDDEDSEEEEEAAAAAAKQKQVATPSRAHVSVRTLPSPTLLSISNAGIRRARCSQRVT
jgi:hypothetical protein